MNILNCPLNGPRNISEFTYGGEFHAMPDSQHCDAREWAEHVFFHDNSAGILIEWWCHTASAYWFLAKRNTVSDEVSETFPASDIFNKRMEFSQVSEPKPSTQETNDGK